MKFKEVKDVSKSKFMKVTQAFIPVFAKLELVYEIPYRTRFTYFHRIET